MKQLYFKTALEWRKWLAENHNKESVLWLIFYKKDTGKISIDYETAVEEALCYGWIDSIIKKIDESKYVRKFTPRKENSKWSVSNKKRIAKLIIEKRITKIGLAKVTAAQKSGLWHKKTKPEINFELPEKFKQALAKNIKAKFFFDQLAPTYQKHYIGWIVNAKRSETMEKRIKETIKLLSKEQKLGLK